MLFDGPHHVHGYTAKLCWLKGPFRWLICKKSSAVADYCRMWTSERHLHFGLQTQTSGHHLFLTEALISQKQRNKRASLFKLPIMRLSLLGLYKARAKCLKTPSLYELHSQLRITQISSSVCHFRGYVLDAGHADTCKDESVGCATLSFHPPLVIIFSQPISLCSGALGPGSCSRRFWQSFMALVSTDRNMGWLEPVIQSKSFVKIGIPFRALTHSGWQEALALPRQRSCAAGKWHSS